MNKQEFLTRLKNALCGLPQNDIQKSLDFYGEMIDDRMEDGLSEEDAIVQIGEIQEIANQILIDTPITKLVKQKIKPTRRISMLEIVLLILGSPIWLSILVSAIAVVISVYVSLWSMVISLWACEASFIGAAFGAGVAATVLIITGQNIFTASIMIAAILLLIGFSVLFFFVCRESTKGMVWITKQITLWIKSFFLRKEKIK